MAVKIGTARGETLRGTQGADVLDGRGGDDRIFGLGGDDLLLGGPGANRLDGGPGRDAVGFLFGEEDGGVLGSSDPTRADLARGTYVVGGEVTRLAGVEDAYGGEADDMLAGDGGANLLSASRGDDVLRGRGGGDTLIDDDGSDLVFGDGGADAITCFGGLGSDEVHAGAGDDTLFTGADGDLLWGDRGADLFQVRSFVAGPDAGAAPLFTIRDFGGGGAEGGDVIDLSALDNDGEGGQEGFEFVGRDGFAVDGVREVRFERRGGDTVVQFETFDEGTPEGVQVNEILLSGRVGLTADDFVLDFIA